MKYHINPETGRPGQCTATVRGCKYAVEGEPPPPHYATKEEAKAGYAKKMEKEVGVVSSLSKKKTDKISVQEGLQQIDNKYIKKYGDLSNMTDEQGRQWLKDKAIYQDNRLLNMNDEEINEYLDQKVGTRDATKIPSEVEKALSYNNNISEKTFERIVNNYSIGAFSYRNSTFDVSTMTSNPKYIQAALNSSRPHNRTRMFNNPNVSSDDLYAMTKKFSDSKYSKDKIKFLANKGYDMSHIGKPSAETKAQAPAKINSIEDEADKAFESITARMKNIDFDRAVKKSEADNVRIPPKYKEMMKTGEFNVKSVKGKISATDKFTRVRLVSEGRKYLDFNEYNRMASRVNEIGRMPTWTKEEQMEVVKKYAELNEEFDWKMEAKEKRDEVRRKAQQKSAERKERLQKNEI